MATTQVDKEVSWASMKGKDGLVERWGIRRPKRGVGGCGECAFPGQVLCYVLHSEIIDLRESGHLEFSTKSRQDDSSVHDARIRQYTRTGSMRYREGIGFRPTKEEQE